MSPAAASAAAGVVAAAQNGRLSRRGSVQPWVTLGPVSEPHGAGRNTKARPPANSQPKIDRTVAVFGSLVSELVSNYGKKRAGQPLEWSKPSAVPKARNTARLVGLPPGQ